MAPCLRRIQQSWWFHIFLAAVIAGGVDAFSCFSTAQEFTQPCIIKGLISAGIYLFAVFQHSPGSSAFHDDGTENQVVKQLVKLTKPIPGNVAKDVKFQIEVPNGR